MLRTELRCSVRAFLGKAELDEEIKAWCGDQRNRLECRLEIKILWLTSEWCDGLLACTNWKSKNRQKQLHTRITAGKILQQNLKSCRNCFYCSYKHSSFLFFNFLLIQRSLSPSFESPSWTLLYPERHENIINGFPSGTEEWEGEELAECKNGKVFVR